MLQHVAGKLSVLRVNDLVDVAHNIVFCGKSFGVLHHCRIFWRDVKCFVMSSGDAKKNRVSAELLYDVNEVPATVARQMNQTPS